MSLHAVSLFSGIGLLDLAMHRAGIPTRLLCEADPSARAVLAHRFPGIPIHPDIRELTADDLRSAGADPARTVLHGGFPCQDLSVAGGRAGMGAGTRSGLYWHIVRLLGEFPARWVVLENVPGLLSSHGGRDMGAVIGSLGDLGYGLAWRVLDAQHFGVPQRRRRVVIVGHLGAPWGAPAQVLLEPEGGGGHPAPVREAGPGAARCPTDGAGIPRLAGSLMAHHGRNAADSDTLLTFQKVVRSGARDTSGDLPPEVWDHRDIAATLSPFDLGSPARAIELVVSARSAAVRGRDDGGSSSSQLVAVSTTCDRTHALTAEGGSEDGTGRGCPIVAVTLTAGTSRRGISTPGRRQEDDVNLVAFDPKAGGNSTSSGAFAEDRQRPHAISTRTVVRRLAPLECERLQGAPDGWTDIGQADSPRYRQLGNAVAVPVFEWVARRLVEVDAERAA